MNKKMTALQKRNSVTAMQKVTTSRSGSLAEHEKHIPPDKIVYPLVDIIEDTDKIFIIADMPGVDKKELNVFIEKDILVIEGYRKKIAQKSKEPVMVMDELVKYIRKLQIGKNLDKNTMKSDFSDGVLEIILNKRVNADGSFL